MNDLLKLEPDGKKKLYLGIEDDQVDGSTEAFTWEWIKKATGIRKKDSFNKHVKKGHFGRVEQISAKNYRMVEGHRDICRFNNGRYPTIKTKIVTRGQYSDMTRGVPIRDMIVTVRGQPFVKPISLKKYNHNDFIEARRFTKDQAMILASKRVVEDINNKTVRWHALAKNSNEYKRRYAEREKMFLNLYISEIVLVAKETASEEEILQATDLPAGILPLIDHKLTLTQANYYISRFVEFQDIISKNADNPILSYRIHQVILEEIQIEHLRDLQRVYGDEINKKVEDALEKALKRHQSLMPDRMGDGRPAEGTGQETGSGPYKPPEDGGDDFA